MNAYKSSYYNAIMFAYARNADGVVIRVRQSCERWLPTTPAIVAQDGTFPSEQRYRQHGLLIADILPVAILTRFHWLAIFRTHEAKILSPSSRTPTDGISVIISAPC